MPLPSDPAPPARAPAADGTDTGATAAPPVLDPTALARIRTTSGAGLVTRLLALFHEHAPTYVAGLDPANVTGYRLAAHTLKSNAATLGLEQLRDACASAEAQAREVLARTGDGTAPPSAADADVLRHLGERVAAAFEVALDALAASGDATTGDAASG